MREEDGGWEREGREGGVGKEEIERKCVCVCGKGVELS